MVEHGINANIAAASGVSGLAALLFGTDAAVVFAAFSGALMSLAFSQQQGFIKAFLWVAGGTVASSFTAPMVMQLTGELPARGVAFIVGFAIMQFLPASIDVIKQVPGQISDRFFGK